MISIQSYGLPYLSEFIIRSDISPLNPHFPIRYSPTMLNDAINDLKRSRERILQSKEYLWRRE